MHENSADIFHFSWKYNDSGESWLARKTVQPHPSLLLNLGAVGGWSNFKNKCQIAGFVLSRQNLTMVDPENET